MNQHFPLLQAPMRQTYENNKRRIQAFKLTANVKDDNGKIHHFVDGYEYVEIGGVKWATCNVGAEKETDSGLYFAWGETQGYKDVNEKDFTWNNYKFVNNANMLKYNNDDELTTLKPCDDAATQNMGKNWRMPTFDDFNTLKSATTNEWATVNGVKGRLFTDKTDESKKLFFPAVGLCYNGSVCYVGYNGFYWSNSLSTSSVCNGRHLYFSSYSYYISYTDRLYGFPVRGVIK